MLYREKKGHVYYPHLIHAKITVCYRHKIRFKIHLIKRKILVFYQKMLRHIQHHMKHIKEHPFLNKLLSDLDHLAWYLVSKAFSLSIT